MAALGANRRSQPSVGHARRFPLPVAALLVCAVVCYRRGASFVTAGPARHDPRGRGRYAGQCNAQPCPAAITRGSPVQRSKIQMFGLLDDIGKGIMNTAANTVTGMDEEERDQLIQKLMVGQMDFNDYITMSVMMQRQGGAMGIVNTLSSIKGMKEALGMAEDVDTDSAEAKMQQYSKIVGAMTEEQRANPGYFTVGSGAEENLAKLVETSEVEEATVKQFLKEFGRMKGFFLRLGAGMRAGKSQEQLGEEMEVWMKEEDEEAIAKPEKKEEPKNVPYINPARAEKRRRKKLSGKKQSKSKIPPPKPRKDALNLGYRGFKGNIFSSGPEPAGKA